MTDDLTGGLLIATSDARYACKGEPDIEERLRKAMRACRNHWMETDEGNQFRAAVAGAFMESEGAERDRIERSAKALAKMAATIRALQSGVAVDLDAMLAEKQDDDLIPLRKLWDDAA